MAFLLPEVIFFSLLIPHAIKRTPGMKSAEKGEGGRGSINAGHIWTNKVNLEDSEGKSGESKIRRSVSRHMW